MEKGRWSYFEEKNLFHIFHEKGIIHAVVNININDKKSARVGDVLIIATDILKVGRNSFTLIERKSRVPQIQDVQGRSRSNVLRDLGNAEDGVSSAFPACWVVAESEA